MNMAIVAMGNKLLLMCSLAAALLSLSPQSMAQQVGATLEQKWAGANGFATYQWIRVDGRHTLYSSDIAMTTSGNRTSFMNTFKVAPFGQFSRCGGLGCDLGVGQKMAQVDFAPKGDHFVVTNASGGLAFLLGSTCFLVDSYMSILECRSSKTPTGHLDMPSIYRFVPGT